MVTRFLVLKQKGGLVAVVEDSVEDLEAPHSWTFGPLYLSCYAAWAHKIFRIPRFAGIFFLLLAISWILARQNLI